MLITIYNNEAKDSFQTNFKSNLILPKNCELKLTNAFISLAHRITIPADATKRTYKLSANDETSGTAHEVVIDAGLYSLSALARELQSKAQAVANAQKLSLDVNVTYDSSKGYGANAINFDIEALTRFANLFQNIPVTTADYATFVENADNVLVQDTTPTINIDNGVNYLGVSSILDTGGNPIDSWGYVVENEEITFHQWLLPSHSGNAHQPPSIPANLEPYGAFSIQDNGKNENYWFGLGNGSTDFTNITTNDFTEFANLDNIPICILVVKKDNGAFTAGSVHVYENSAGGLLEVGKLKTGFSANDKIGVSVQNGTNVVYWYRPHNGNKWKHIPIKHSAQRYTPTTGEPLNFTYAVFEKNTAGTTNASMKNWYGSFADDDHEEVSNYGQYIKWDWNGNGTDLGFTELSYEDKETGTDLAELIFHNEDDLKVDGDNDNETYKTAPYINLMIENLPVNSYTDINTDTSENELDMSKCVASIPRYDQNGKFSIGYNLLYNPVEANVIKLHNEHEINVSQLRFRLQQADGQIPQDLDQPMSFVFDFNGEK
tara:strand:- start:195 stop:1835 length:1641 start_codon:yes stop_codon:yes gene_type:complete